MRKIIAEYAIIYTLGALGYGALEMLWRGHTHWTMTVTGGLCFMLIYFINDYMRQYSLLKKCLACAAGVTVIEFFVGCIVNLWLGWAVWDYSKLPFSLFGQVCLGFCLLWFLLCIPMLLLSDLLQRRIFCYKV